MNIKCLRSTFDSFVVQVDPEWIVKKNYIYKKLFKVLVQENYLRNPINFYHYLIKNVFILLI